MIDETKKLTWEEIVHAIFARQEELMVKYKEMEKLPDPPLSLHTMHGQRILKDFAWRVTEELGEAHEQWARHEQPYTGEEMADALHFLVELMIFAGLTPAQAINSTPKFPTPSEVRPGFGEEAGGFWRATFDLTMAMHCLKNKPWKKTPVATDEGEFRTRLLAAFRSHIELWVIIDFAMVDVYNFYFKKSAVNQQRQQGNY